MVEAGMVGAEKVAASVEAVAKVVGLGGATPPGMGR